MKYHGQGKMRFVVTKTKIPRMSAPRIRRGPPPMKKLLPKWQNVKAIVETPVTPAAGINGAGIIQREEEREGQRKEHR